MTVYAGNQQQFRLGPSATAQVAVGAAASVIAAGLSSLVLSACDLVMAYVAGWPGPVALYAPLVDLPQGLLFSTPPLDTEYLWAPLAVPAAAGALAFVLLYFWPTGQKLSTRLFVLQCALIMATLGLAAPLLDRASLEEVSALTGLPALANAAIACLLAGTVVLLAERRAVALLDSLDHGRDMRERLSSWMYRIPIGLVIVIILCLANNDIAAACAVIGALLLSVIPSTTAAAHVVFERLERPQMREAAITAPLIAIVIASVMTYLFGMDAAGLRRQAVLLSMTTGITVEPLRLVQPSGEIRGPYATPSPDPSPTPEVKIRMRWSKTR